MLLIAAHLRSPFTTQHLWVSTFQPSDPGSLRALGEHRPMLTVLDSCVTQNTLGMRAGSHQDKWPSFNRRRLLSALLPNQSKCKPPIISPNCTSSVSPERSESFLVLEQMSIPLGSINWSEGRRLRRSRGFGGWKNFFMTIQARRCCQQKATSYTGDDNNS